MSEALVLTLPETLFLIGGLILLALPGAVTDYRSGKIRNSLIIVLLFLVFIGVYVVWSQLDTAFWMTSGIVLGFGYLLYLYDRWGAGDGKYFIVLGFLILLLERFLKISSSGLLWFTLLSFGWLALWIIATLLWKMRSQWKNIETPLAPFSRDIVILGGIFSVITTLLIPYIPIEGRSIGIAMIFLLGGRYIQQVSLGMAGPVVIAGAFVFSVVYGSLWTLGISIVFFYIFRVIEQVSEELFERVDTRLIPLILIQQGDIVSPNSRKDIQELLWVELRESPLQGYDVYELLSKTQSLGLEKTQISIFESIKMGIILYGAFVIVLIWMGWRLTI